MFLMISYMLKCCHGHAFEGWFGSSGDFEDQQMRGLMTCPICETSDVRKGLMTPQLPRKSNQQKAAQKQAAIPSHIRFAQGKSEISSKDIAALYAHMREVQNTIVNNCDDVGNCFAEEARKIHYGETEERGIYGKASSEEAEELAEEGIEAIAVPWLPPEN
jgi:hypothetical protein